MIYFVFCNIFSSEKFNNSHVIECPLFIFQFIADDSSLASSGRGSLSKNSPSSKRKLNSLSNNVATEEKQNSLSCCSPDILNSHSGLDIDDDCTSGSTVNPLYEMLTEKGKIFAC